MSDRNKHAQIIRLLVPKNEIHLNYETIDLTLLPECNFLHIQTLATVTKEGKSAEEEVVALA